VCSSDLGLPGPPRATAWTVGAIAADAFSTVTSPGIQEDAPMRLGNCLRRFSRLRDYLLGGHSPRNRDRLVRLGVEGLGDRTVPSAVTGTLSSVVTVEKIGDAAEGGADGIFRFTRTGDTTDSLVIDVSYGGTATRADDYLPDSPFACVTLPAGASSIDVSVRAVADGEYDPGETVAVTVLPPGFMATGHYDPGAEYEAALAIADGQSPNTADPSTGDGLPPSAEPARPAENTVPAIPPSGSETDGMPTGSVDSIDGPAGGVQMRPDFAGAPATAPAESDSLAGDDIVGRLP